MKYLSCLLIFIAFHSKAQTISMDSTLQNIPTVNNKIVYNGVVAVEGRSKAYLDSLTKRWFSDYFKYRDALKDSSSTSSENSIYSRVATIFVLKPYLIKVSYYAIMSVQIKCIAGSYQYRFFDTYLTMTSQGLRALGSFPSTDYMLSEYKKKHWSFFHMGMDRTLVRQRLSGMDGAIRASIRSLTDFVK